METRSADPSTVLGMTVGVIPSERSESRDLHLGVIPSERSESRDLHSIDASSAPQLCSPRLRVKLRRDALKN